MLFGKIFNEITLEEALYILNMDNYKKELNNFQYLKYKVLLLK